VLEEEGARLGAAATLRASIARRAAHPINLMVPVVAVGFYALWRNRLIAHIPYSAILVTVLVAEVASLLAFAAWGEERSGWRLWALAGIDMCAIGSVIYAIGWGPVFVIALIIGAADMMRRAGSAVTEPSIVFGSLVIGFGQLGIALGFVPSLIRPPLAHSLAGLEAIALVITVALLGWFAIGRERAEEELHHDIARREAAEERLAYAALHDPLTGLPNRTLILDRAEQMLARARREHLRTPPAALFVDLDDFKDINDTLGHEAGDRFLQAVADRLSRLLRATDTVGRLGGDEFVVLAEGLTVAAGPELVAERIQAVLKEPFEVEGWSGVPLTVTASVGIACGDRASAQDLLRDADIALYRAKAKGKSRCTLFQPEMQSAILDRLAFEMDLRAALGERQFFLVYQPVFDLESVSVCGVEALLRWRHPTRGVVAPAQFVPILEESGLILDVGRWVLNEACSHAAAWHRRGHLIKVSVNVSMRQLESERFLDHLDEALSASGLDPGSLVIEVTETTLMRDTDATIERLHGLKDKGVLVAIDDFGTGYSSLAYLRQFPVDALKIDRSFVGAMADSTESTALIHTLVQLGRTLGLETLAEGIEDHWQLEELQREKCELGQGFFLSHPLELESFEHFLEEINSPKNAQDRAG
jgi:diguanylate cyclase (GGDEF)-like protein